MVHVAVLFFRTRSGQYRFTLCGGPWYSTLACCVQFSNVGYSWIDSAGVRDLHALICIHHLHMGRTLHITTRVDLTHVSSGASFSYAR